jgi:hypothetical protein
MTDPAPYLYLYVFYLLLPDREIKIKAPPLPPSEATMVDHFDIEHLRLRDDWTPSPKRARKRSTKSEPARKLPEPQPGEAYLTGPVPMGWIEEATRLSGRTWQVACALWFVGIRSKTKSATVTLTEKTRRRFHLSECAVKRGLRQLADVGLVIVERHSGTYSVVTILSAPVPKEREV